MFKPIHTSIALLILFFTQGQVLAGDNSAKDNTANKAHEEKVHEDATANQILEKLDLQPKAKDIRARLVFKSEDLSDDEKEVIDLAEKARGEVEEGEWWSKSEVVSYNLDDKGKKEIFYSGSSNFECGSAGCPLVLYQYKNKKWQILQQFRTVGDVIVLNHKTIGYYDISIGIKYRKILSPDKIKGVKTTKIQEKDIDDWVFEWKNFTLTWNQKYYCSKELKSC